MTDKTQANWSKARADHFVKLLAENGPKDIKKLARLMKDYDGDWVYTEQQLRTRIDTLKRQGVEVVGGRKRAPEQEKVKKTTKKARKDMLDDSAEDSAKGSSSDASHSGSDSDSDGDGEEAADEPPKPLRLRGRLARNQLPLVVPVTKVTLKGYFLLIWPLVGHTGFKVEVLPTAPARLRVLVRVTEVSEEQLKAIVGSAMRRQRTFDEVEQADFSSPAPLEEAQLQRILAGDGDAEAAFRKAIHRAPGAECKEGPAPLTYEMKLPSDVDYGFPAAIVNTGNLPYQAVLLRTRQNFGGAEWMSQSAEAMAVDFLRVTRNKHFGLAPPKAPESKEKSTAPVPSGSP